MLRNPFLQGALMVAAFLLVLAGCSLGEPGGSILSEAQRARWSAEGDGTWQNP